MRSVVLFSAAMLLLAPASASLAQERTITVVAKGSLNTSGRLYPNPNAADPVARAQSFSFSDFYGIGGEVQYHFANSNVFLGLGSEYIHNDGGRNIVATAQSVVPVEDNYRVIPVEFTAYFRIPVTAGAFSVVMGGGVAAYFGERHVVMAGVDAPSTASTAGFGIHVLGGFAYRISERFTASADIKFRDAQFQTVNAFAVPNVKYGNIFVQLPQGPFASNVHTDGMVIQVGIGVNL